MSKRWTLTDINWDRFDRAAVSPRLLEVVKTAALVEANSGDYVSYLKNVFPDDPVFHREVEVWGLEERQHGEALGRWAELADPSFDFGESLALFQRLYSLPVQIDSSVRGSQPGELIARCVVETGTSTFYSAIRDAAREPVLAEIADNIATDEFLHYQLFKKYYRRYEAASSLSLVERLRIAVGRVNEAEDEELGYAYFAANVLPEDPDARFDADLYGQEYYRRAMGLYRERHINTATRMIMRAACLNSHGRLGDIASKLFWSFVRWKVGRLERQAA